MSRKITVFVVSLILVVSVTIDVAVAVDPHIQSPQKSTEVIICENSDDQKLCHETLESVKGLDSADMKPYLAAVLKATTDTVIKAINISDSLITDPISNDYGVNASLINCKELMEYAMTTLQKCINLVQNDIQHVLIRDPNFVTEFSAVMSYEEGCLDGFDYNRDNEKWVMEQLQTQSLNRLKKLISMTLNIGWPHILEQLMPLIFEKNH